MKRFSILAACLLLSGCVGSPAQNYVPAIDLQGVDMSRYQADLKDCQGYGATHDPARAAANSAIAGAIVGALLGAAIGGGRMVATGAAIGGTEAGAAGGVRAAETAQLVVQRCMAGRGYRVLD